MKRYAVLGGVSGEILRVGNCADADFELQASAPGEVVIEPTEEQYLAARTGALTHLDLP